MSATSSWQESVLSEWGDVSRDSCSLDRGDRAVDSLAGGIYGETGWPYDRRQPAGSGAGFPTHFCGDTTGRRPLLNHPFYRVEKRDLARCDPLLRTNVCHLVPGHELL